MKRISAVAALSMAALHMMGTGCDNSQADLPTVENVLGAIDTPVEVDFGAVEPVTQRSWDSVWKVVDLLNSGDGPLRIESITVNPEDAPFRISFPDPARRLGPVGNDTVSFDEILEAGDFLPLRIFFNPRDLIGAVAHLDISSDDPDRPTHRIEVRGNVAAPCLAVEPAMVDFGEVPKGSIARQNISLHNCNDGADLQIENTQMISDGRGAFAIDSLAGLLNVVPPGQSLEFDVLFTPGVQIASEGLIVVSSDDPDHASTEIPLFGRRGDDCPTPVALARLMGQEDFSEHVDTVTEKTIEFDGTMSRSRDSDVVSYEWTILAQPTGSTATMLPNRRSAKPTLFLDKPGIFEIGLDVYDAAGRRSCGEQVVVQLVARTQAAIEVRVSWRPAEDDTVGGQDLDLHYLHVLPEANWEVAPYDIFSGNPTQDWGRPGPIDDPFWFQVEQSNGGEELIRHNHPVDGRYHVVAYHAGGQPGTAFARTTIHVNGFERHVYENREVENIGRSWDIAVINWPMGTVEPRNREGTGFPDP
jgi:hypothetical protein